MARPVVLCAAHLGYPMDQVPLGGGGMAALHLARLWARERPFELSALGAGPLAPGQAPYTQVLPGAPDPSRLSELAYARFCRDFAEKSTSLLLARAPERPIVLVNDISESPDLARLKAAGLGVVSIWHVDVVAFFSKMYMKGAVSPRRAAALYESVRRAGLERAVPGLLKLIYAKQRASVIESDLIFLPSSGMAETLLDCYGGLASDLARKIRVQPWGALPGCGLPDKSSARESLGLRPGSAVLLTMSRISPEKGLGLLLDALRLLEARRPGELTLLLCGAPAFMGGQAAQRRLRRGAARLKRFRVRFEGYVSGEAKALRLAAADLFVSPSRHESYGLSAAEALAAGLPVLATATDGLRELIKPGWGLQAPDRPEAFAQALSELLSRPEKLQTMSRAAFRAVPPFEQAARAMARELQGLV